MFQLCNCPTLHLRNCLNVQFFICLAASNTSFDNQPTILSEYIEIFHTLFILNIFRCTGLIWWARPFPLASLTWQTRHGKACALHVHCACPTKPWRHSSGCMCHMDSSWPAPPARIWPSVFLYGFSAHICAGMFGCTLSISELPAFFRSALQICWWTWQSRGPWWSVVVVLRTRRQIKSFNFSLWCTTPCAYSFGTCSCSPCCRTGRCAEAGHSA